MKDHIKEDEKAICNAEEALLTVQRVERENAEAREHAARVEEQERAELLAQSVRDQERAESKVLVNIARYEERVYAASAIEAVRNEERTHAASAIEAIRSEGQAHAAGLVQAARDEERARAALLVESTREHEQVRAAAQLRAAEEESLHALAEVGARYSRRVTDLQEQAESLAASLGRLREDAEKEKAEAVEDVEREAARAMKEEQDRSHAEVAEIKAHTDELLADTQGRLDEALDKADAYLELVESVATSHLEDQRDLEDDLRAQLRAAKEESENLRGRVRTLEKKNDVLRKKVERVSDQLSLRTEDKTQGAAPQPANHGGALRLKEKGVIPDPVRALIRDLMSFGLKVSQIKHAIATVAAASGAEVDGEISRRSMLRVMKEGGVAAGMQVVDDIKAAQTITISSDGTTHRHIQYDARHIILNNGGEHIQRTLGITSAPDHKSETQAQHWKDRVREFFDWYNASPRGAQDPADLRTFALKLAGMLTDHAEDQKKLFRLIMAWKKTVDREVRGEAAMKVVSLPELLLAIAEETNAAVERAGGETVWATLSLEALDAWNVSIQNAVAQRLGETAYQALSEEERAVADLFIQGGCCMHKELNAFKGGNTRMVAFWATKDIQPPILLLNRDNDAAASAGNSAARTRAIEQSRGGAAKLAELAGAAFHHKNDKKGQQDSMRYYFEASDFGELLTFPPVNATRYGSHGDAASYLIAYLELFRNLLGVMDNKKGEGLNHMERNVQKGLNDIPTLTELCALSLYSETVSHPYMRLVRAPSRPNLLELGTLHDRLMDHIQRIIDNPDLLLGSDACFEHATLDGEGWNHPDAFEGVQRLLPSLPYLRPVVVEFFKGALDTWTRFAADFAIGGTIDRLTAEQRERAWMPATNDANEGALGSYRVGARQTPNITLDQYNAKVMYGRNGTAAYIAETLTPVDRKHLRAYTRELDGSGRERKHRMEIAESEQVEAAKRRRQREVATEKEEARREKLKAVVPVWSLQHLKRGSTTVAFIDEQLDWHREWVDTGPREQKTIPLKTHLPRKKEQLRALRAAVRRYNTDPALRERAKINLIEMNVHIDDGVYSGDEVEVGFDSDDEE